MSAATRHGKVTVVGAGFYGSTTAQRLAEYDVFETVVLTDIIEGTPEGLALDMNQSRPIEGFETKVVGASTTRGRRRLRGDRRLGRRGDHGRPAAQARHEPHGPARGQRQDRARGRREHRRALARRRDHRGVEPARRDDRAGPAGLGLPEARACSARPACSTRPGSPTTWPPRSASPVGSVTTLTLGSHGDTMVPVPVRLLRRRQAAGRRHAGRADRRARHSAPATAAPRWSRCSRPGRRTTRRRPPRPAWPGP